MSIFNSLGSNYDFGFALRTLFAISKEGNSEKLKKLLEEKYQGKAILTYKGREALRLALRSINKSEEYAVGICGFTCFAVYEAVAKEGYKVEYLDIEKDSINFSPSTLEKAIKENPKLKIVIIQNTLGYVCDIESISEICKKENIVLIEDLALSIGARYKEGESGTIGDFVALSFSQDKMVDGMSGGALVVRNKKYNISDFNFQNLSERLQIKNRFYPFLTFLIRKTYQARIGKILHYLLKKANFLSKPVENADLYDIHHLPVLYCGLIKKEFLLLKKNLSHRKTIAKIYSQTVNKSVLSQKINSGIESSSNLRYPIFVKRRDSLINFLNGYSIYISDTWYDAPIAPRRFLSMTDYKKGDCPNSENISEKILNLPTHRNVSEKDAAFIAQKINLWLKSQ